MALGANEKIIGGFVRDVANGYVLVCTTNTAGAKMSSGFLRDPDGRLVVVVGA
jgi:hypothetical protein